MSDRQSKKTLPTHRPRCSRLPSSRSMRDQSMSSRCSSTRRHRSSSRLSKSVLRPRSSCRSSWSVLRRSKPRESRRAQPRRCVRVLSWPSHACYQIGTCMPISVQPGSVRTEPRAGANGSLRPLPGGEHSPPTGRARVDAGRARRCCRARATIDPGCRRCSDCAETRHGRTARRRVRCLDRRTVRAREAREPSARSTAARVGWREDQLRSRRDSRPIGPRFSATVHACRTRARSRSAEARPTGASPASAT